MNNKLFVIENKYKKNDYDPLVHLYYEDYIAYNKNYI